MKKVLEKSILNLIAVLPMILAVVLLVGLLQTFVPPEKFSYLFGKSAILDTLSGTLIGAISAGHGMISYVIGEGLLNHGVSVYGVAAFILSWVTLGLIQLPAEASMFGVRFTFYRNILALVSTIFIAYATVWTVEMLS